MLSHLQLQRVQKLHFAATRFDTPSQTKHGFGKTYGENGKQRLKLNVQIEFAK